MAASSVTGTGVGSSNKVTTLELSKLANAPTIYIAGYVVSEDLPVSPPSIGNTVVFPNPLMGGTEDYIVMLTTQNSGYAYVNDMNENDDGNFIGFSFVTESEGTLMYTVIKTGLRPNV